MIFTLNRGAQAPRGQRLTNPDLIWPGMTLRIPVPKPVEAAPPPEVAPEAAAPAPEAPEAPATPETAATPETPTVATSAPPAPAPAAECAAVTVTTPVPALSAPGDPGVPAPIEGPAHLWSTPVPDAGTAMAPTGPVEPDPAPPPPVVIAPTAAAPGLPPAASAPVPSTPAWPGPDPRVMAGLLATGVAAVTGWALARRRRQQGLAVTSDDRLLPIVLNHPVVADEESGLTSRALAPQTRQRQAGLEADNRVVATNLVLEALAAVGWPFAQVVSLLDRADCLQYRITLNGPAPTDLTALADRLEEHLSSPI